jgi:hypothetical protein
VNTEQLFYDNAIKFLRVVVMLLVRTQGFTQQDSKIVIKHNVKTILGMIAGACRLLIKTLLGVKNNTQVASLQYNQTEIERDL